MTRVLLISNDIVGTRMAGPGIRYWEMREALSHHFDAVLAIPPFLAPHMAKEIRQPWLCICHTTSELEQLINEADILITLGIVPWMYPAIINAKKPLVIDLYDPFLIESLQRYRHSPLSRQMNSFEHYLEALWLQLQSGDFFICASERQRDYWLGMLSAAGRLNPLTYGEDPSLRRLIEVVPFGIPATPPQHTHQVLKGIHPGIAASDRLLIWGGGLWEWFDPITLIHAMPLILKQRSDVKLFFMGIQRPNQLATPSSTVEETTTLARSLGLEGTFVLFNDWVPYEERQNYLLEADVGISLHLDHIESRLAFRTRLLDYLWTGLPILATKGDLLGEELSKQGLAKLVAPHDVAGTARTILDMLQAAPSPQERKRRIQAALRKYRWDTIIRPLANFCADPYFAADKAYHPTAHPPRRGWQRSFHRGWRIIREEGLQALIQEIGQYLQWRRFRR